MSNKEYAMLCPTCGGLPVDHAEMERLRAALAEALDGWEAMINEYGAPEWNRQHYETRIAELRKLVKP